MLINVSELCKTFQQKFGVTLQTDLVPLESVYLHCIASQINCAKLWLLQNYNVLAAVFRDAQMLEIKQFIGLKCHPFTRCFNFMCVTMHVEVYSVINDCLFAKFVSL